MTIEVKELQMYKNFDELVNDVLDFAKEIFPDQLFFLSSINETKQIILKLSNEHSSILLSEGMVLNLEDTLCNRMNFEEKQPLIYEDLNEAENLGRIREMFEQANVRSYLGLPISLANGEKFGTLCAINNKKSKFDKKSINLLQRIVRMFSYYLYLEHCAHRDTLTELYNRRYLTQYFAEHPRKGGGIFYLDLDGFKKVNDVHGHDKGDLVLKEVALRLQEFVSEHQDAFAVRLGGDEFVIIFSQSYSAEEWRRKVNRVLNCLSTWETNYDLSASIGVVIYSEDSEVELNMLLKNADTALYQAKTAGKNTFKFFENES